MRAIGCGIGANLWPVSYTHLDVYKRQGRTIKVRGRTAANIESAFGVGVLRRYIILPDKTYTDAELHYILPVSYTHLSPGSNAASTTLP